MNEKYTWDKTMGSYNQEYDYDEIIALQKKLGFTGDKLDGKYGPITHRANISGFNASSNIESKKSLIKSPTKSVLPKELSLDMADKGIVPGGKSDGAGNAITKNAGATGAAIGAASSAISSVANLAVTLASKENKKESPFANYANDALGKIGELDSMASRMKDLNKADLTLSSNTQRVTNRNSARGINDFRAMELGTHVAGLGVQRDIEREYQGRLADNAKLEANMLLERDKTKMAAQERTNEINQANRDNFNSNLSQNISDLGALGQTYARNVNIAEENEIKKVLASQGKYGSNYFGYVDTNHSK
jgi:hypothetical protein